MIELLYNWLFRTRLENVFTPGKIATINYLNRPELENKVQKALHTPGVQLVLYGHSGSGKTTLVRKVLERNKISFVRTQCKADMKFEDIILNAFDDLNTYYVSERTSQRSLKISQSVKADCESIATDISHVNEDSYGQKMIRLLPPRLTPQRLSELFRNIGLVWMIEDFHKLAKDEKQKLADVIKIFVDESNEVTSSKISKIICIGAVCSPRELLSLDTNLTTRVDQIKVPLLTDEEIKEIIVHGCKLLNVGISDRLLDNLVSYSNNIGALAHSMCYDICYEANIRKTFLFKKKIKDKSFNVAIQGYIDKNSDTFKQTYDLITAQNKTAWYILKSLNTYSKESISFQKLRVRINPKNKQISDTDIQNALEELLKPPYSIIRFDEDSKTYSFSTPFWKAFIRIQMDIEQVEVSQKKKKSNALLLDQNNFESMTLNILFDRINQLKNYQKNHK